MSYDRNPDVDQTTQPSYNKRDSLILIPRFRLRLGECFIARGVSPDRYFAATEQDATLNIGNQDQTRQWSRL
jgi:hypothetical protein